MITRKYTRGCSSKFQFRVEQGAGKRRPYTKGKKGVILFRVGAPLACALLNTAIYLAPPLDLPQFCLNGGAGLRPVPTRDRGVGYC